MRAHMQIEGLLFDDRSDEDSDSTFTVSLREAPMDEQESVDISTLLTPFCGRFVKITVEAVD